MAAMAFFRPDRAAGTVIEFTAFSLSFYRCFPHASR